MTCTDENGNDDDKTTKMTRAMTRMIMTMTMTMMMMMINYVYSGFQRLILALSVAALCGSISFMLVRIVLYVNLLSPR